MLRKVRLYGDLAKFVGHRVLHADVNNAAQAIRFLVANWPELNSYMADRYYKVVSSNWEIAEEELHHPTGSSDIQIIPVIGGAGNNTTRIIMGVALIGASIAFPGLAIGLGSLGSIGLAGTVGSIGMGLALNGIAGLLAPVDEIDSDDQDPRRSFAFSGIQNTSRAGVCVPICYGEVITGSIVISAGIDTVQVEA